MKGFMPHWKRPGILALYVLGLAALSLVSGPLVLQRAAGVFCPAPDSFETVRESFQASDAVLFDRKGRVIHELRVNPEIRRLGWVRLEEVSPLLIKAVIHSEDRRFYRHHGVDWMAAVHAGVQNFFSASSRRGASTLSMQVAGLIDKTLSHKKGERTFIQKIRQALSALILEQSWTKDRIMEAYLNLVAFKGEIQGIAAASQGYFGKQPQGLDETEALILAALIRAPNAAAAQLITRACRLRDQLSFTLPDEVIREAALKLFSGPYRIRPPLALAPHVARSLLKTRANVTSTLDAGVQMLVTESLKKHLAGLRDRNVRDGAALVLDNRTGEVLSWVGNTGKDSSAGHVDGVLALRQAGSTLKPFLYGLAIEQRLLTAASLLTDSPVNLPTLTGIYAPQNYDDAFKGLVSVRTCLSASLNIPAVRAILLTGSEAFAARLRDLGFSHLTFGEFYGASLALGAADVSLYELTNAYRTLANKGKWSLPSLLPPSGSGQDLPPPKQVMDERATFIISDILSDRGARSLTFGLENPLSTRFWTAVKTGTSKDMRDNWCIGYSDRFTVGVWVGNFSGEPMWNVSGISGAAPVWLETMSYLHQDALSAPPGPPSGVVKETITYAGDSEPRRGEWFISGTQTSRIEEDRMEEAKAKITYPPDGTLFALDPDIPEDRQMIFFTASPKSSAFKWVLDQRVIRQKTQPIGWKPAAGSHTLSLLNASGRVLDSVSFEVRGGKLK